MGSNRYTRKHSWSDPICELVWDIASSDFLGVGNVFFVCQELASRDAELLESMCHATGPRDRNAMRIVEPGTVLYRVRTFV